MVAIHEIGLQKPLGSRGGPGQYCLLNAYSIRVGGSGALGFPTNNVNAGTDRTAAIVDGANRNVVDNGASQQLQTSIALPMPLNLRTAYGADWTVDDVGWAERGIANAGAAIFGNQSLDDWAASIIPGLKGNVGNELTKFGYSTAFRKSLKDYGVAYNPHKELFYSGPTFRTLPLQWQFSFDNKADAEAFKATFEALAVHMHPDFVEGAASGVWKIPDTIYVEFVNADVRKYGAMVLVGLETDYTASGAGWRAFNDGKPSHVSLNMILMELAPRTKRDIQAGM